MELKNQSNDHVVIVTSEAEDASVKKFRIKARTVWAALIAACVVIGALVGYIAYEEQIWTAAMAANDRKIEEYQEKTTELTEEIADLEAEKSALQAEIENLNSKVTILSDTVTQLKAVEEELTAENEKYVTPTLLPITGSATIEEVTEGEPMNIFTAAEGAVAVSTAAGVISEVSEDSDYGYRVVIDHRNGYKTIYRNEGKPLASQGDSIAQGGVLFVIEDDNTKLGYQIMKDDVYVNPAEMMEIKG